ncbi:MAG: methylated-DNA--[protein]-cysteine S-methyltransferase [Phycisphaerales bacterium]
MSDLAFRTIESPFGPMRAVASERGVRVLSFDGAGERAAGESAVLARLERELAAYFAGDLAAFSVALDLEGTAWQRRVWRELTGIPCGETISYGELARRLGNSNAARPAGLANGANPVAIVVPCHRVIASDGTLGGYAGGLKRKRWLLDHEASMSGAPTLF